jgi:hypothetical protein
VRGIGTTEDERRWVLLEKQDIDVDEDATESEDNPRVDVEGAAAVIFEFRRPKGRREDFGDGMSDSALSSVRATECSAPRFKLGLLVVLVSSESFER